MVDHVQETIGYRFFDCGLLRVALKTAHRSEEDETSDDGNRGLAKIGASIIEMVETHDIVMTKGKTKSNLVVTSLFLMRSPTRPGDAESRQHWSKTKKGRANACRRLGIEPCIVQSVRQKHERPSTTILANALSAIVGAVWLDLEKQDERSATARTKVFNILRHIDSIIADTAHPTLNTANGGIALDPEGNKGRQLYEEVSHFGTSDVTISRDAIDMHTIMPHHLGENQQGVSSGMLTDVFPLNETTSDPNSLLLNDMNGVFSAPKCDVSLITKQLLEAQMHVQDNMNLFLVEGEMDFDIAALPQLDEAFQQFDERLWIESEGVGHAEPTALRKRKQAHSGNGTYDDNPAYCNLLRIERQKSAARSMPERDMTERYLVCIHIDDISQSLTQVKQLRSLYLGIGSCGTLLDFEELLRVARQKKIVYSHPSKPDLSIMERYNEICRLESEEALCVLARRYHVIKFCDTEQEVFRQNNCIIMETSSTFGAAHKAQRGNPNVLREAAMTAALATQIRPGLKEESKECKKFCDKVKRLRKLARNLQMLTNVYGFGILALLPSGPSYQDLSITDTVLVHCIG